MIGSCSRIVLAPGCAEIAGRGCRAEADLGNVASGLSGTDARFGQKNSRMSIFCFVSTLPRQSRHPSTPNIMTTDNPLIFTTPYFLRVCAANSI